MSTEGTMQWAVEPQYAGDSDSNEDDSSKDGSVKGSDLNSGGANSDAEGVWSPDIEQSFQEALAIYPPCGRRKIILSDEGKMYGRNELIARYIKLRTGKTRTRKQVSSHIQVLARRKAREIQSKLKSMSSMSSAQIVSIFYSPQDQAAKEKALQSLTSAQIASLQNIQNKAAAAAITAHHPTTAHHTAHVATAAAGLAALGLAAPPSVTPYTPSHFWQPAGPTTDDIKPFNDVKPFNAITGNNNTANQYNSNHPNSNNNNSPAYQGRSIATHKLRLVEFTAFMERGNGQQSDKHIFAQIGGLNPSYSDPLLEDIDIRQISDKFPANKGGLKELYDKGPSDAFFLVKFWADLNIPPTMADENGAFYGVTALFESTESMTISCSTKVCSFGKQVVEKVEVEYPIYQNGRYVYRIEKSPMCEYMVNFIHKLKDLPEKYMMNSVLENFTILQVVTNRETQETLLCIAFVFEVSVSEHGAQHHIYTLVKPNNNNDNH
ncbi:transcriptional enhancer factor TEF-1-like protein [Leptotrombidium deliense]|uniref:Transcriptional enhancer factor TEF-1-like protein n=1 Tax=Leptotrombidium deliense TaxID=299467 RepID=A0A443SUU6_9ACAR|nr:transcriptional enhancer factor TEF-1-like protein [Leptotrombidium deliense]